MGVKKYIAGIGLVINRLGLKPVLTGVKPKFEAQSWLPAYYALFN